MKVEYKKQNGKWLNVKVTKDGKTISSVIEEIEPDGTWTYITLDVDFSIDFFSVMDFVLFTNTGFNDDTFLCFFEPEQSLEHCMAIGQKMWQNQELIGRCQKEFLICPELRAIYIPKFKPTYRNANLGDCETGRWLFAHPDGSKAAYEHMMSTTLLDDYYRLMPYLENAKIAETFDSL